MALTIVFTIIFSGALLLRDYKNKYSLIFALMAFGMSIAMTTVIIEIHRNGNYYFLPGIPYSGMESRLFYALNRRLSLSLSDLSLVRNLGITLYFFMNFWFMLSFDRCMKNSVSVKKRRYLVTRCLMVSYCVLYFIFYHPWSGYRFFLWLHTAPMIMRRSWSAFVVVTDIFMTAAAVIYLAYPIVFLAYNYAKNRLTFFLGQLMSLVITLASLNAAFLYFFICGSFRDSSASLLQSGFWRSISIVFVPRFYASIMPILSFAVLLAVSYLLIRYQTASLLDGLKEYSISKKLQGLYTNLRDVMHSEKNVMFNMRILAEESLELYGTEEGKNKLLRIKELSEDHIVSLTNNLNSFKALNVRAISQDLYIAIDQALDLCSMPGNVRLVKNYHCDSADCNYDLYHMTQAIVNLLSNALDGTRDCPDPCITLDVDTSDYWVCFSIIDNGCGIPKDAIGRIYDPYFSTKPKQNNWGIGLSYVFRVVRSHYGYIRVKSRPGEYTAVEILLTRERQQ